MPTDNEILSAIPSTEPATFGEFLDGLPDVPAKGEREEWSALFRQIRSLETAGYIEVERASTGGSIESLMLTGEGVEAVKRARR